MDGPESSSKKVLLALGSGGARGMAHIGVLRVLASAGYEVVGVAGSSIGAAIGAVYGSRHLDEYEARMRQMTRKDVLAMLDPGLPTTGLFGGVRFERLMRDFCGEVDIDHLDLPFIAIATDIETGTEVRIRHGDLVLAVRASGSIPGLFRPVRLEGRWLVDGGLVSPVPVDAARTLGNAPVVAVNLNSPVVSDSLLEAEQEPEPESSAEAGVRRDQEEGPLPRPREQKLEGAKSRVGAGLKAIRKAMQPARRKSPGIVGSLNESVSIICHQLSQAQFAIQPPDLLIEPRLSGVGLFDLHRTEEVISEGERAAVQALEDAGWAGAQAKRSGTV